MTEQVWEGTWEEIKKRGEGLANRRVRLILLPEGADEQPNGENGQRLSEQLADLVNQAESLDATSPESAQSTDPYEIAYGEIVAEKFRKQGFNV
ncbi:MAG TPA: hypothetical protein VGM51_02765 [Armatimonadota bacterium]|jgi:hypothetical protein